MPFQPDYTHFASVMRNERPVRLPLYEHSVNATMIEKLLGVRFAGLENGHGKDLQEYFRRHCEFFHTMTYDTVSYEVCIGQILPGHTALCGGQGPIQSRGDFEKYPWQELPGLYWRLAQPRFDALAAALPPGMKAVGGIGHGVFELAEALVGLEYLPLIQMDDPELYADLFQAIGGLMHTLWAEFMPRYGHHFVACRFGDDLGFKSSLLTNPRTVRDHIIPQYQHIIDTIHAGGGAFLWHSCGCIFEIMEDVIALGINAKHSNEEAIAPFERWIRDYGTRIGLLGGFDLDLLCSRSEQEVYDVVLRQGRQFRASARGYALGSGNSIPDYVPVDNYRAMMRAAQDIRKAERG
jgi:uroporphyrinogen decarboxylase